MRQKIQDSILGNIDDFELEHRCYNGVCLIAACGCLGGAVNDYFIKLPIVTCVITSFIGVIFLWLYVKSRSSEDYLPMIWLYILLGTSFLLITWFYNGGVYGPSTIISITVLVAIMIVLKSRKYLAALIILILMSIFFVLEFLYPDSIIGYSSKNQHLLDIYVTLMLVVAVIYTCIFIILHSYNHERMRLDDVNRLLEEKMKILNRSNRDLEKALAEVKTLSGLLPICSTCKKIRDDKGYWNQIETYISNHSEADFSHSVCPECAKKLYPDMDIYDDNGGVIKG